MDTEAGTDSIAYSESPLHEDFEDALIRKFDGFWLHEDDPDVRSHVDQLFRLFYRARDLFETVGPHLLRPRDEGWIAPLHLAGSMHIHHHAYAIFEHEDVERPDSLTERARQICSLGGRGEDGKPEFSDGQIYASLALSEIVWALDALCDVCMIFQSEIAQYIQPLTIFRASFPDDYRREADELRARNWREERDKFIEAFEYKASAEKMLLLATMASDGVMPHRFEEFALEMRSAGAERGHEAGRAQGRDEWRLARKSKREERNVAIEGLAREWGTFTPATFCEKLRASLSNGVINCPSTGGALSLDVVERHALRYVSASGTKAIVSSEALKKILQRSKHS
jgi:hypothetical protein